VSQEDQEEEGEPLKDIEVGPGAEGPSTELVEVTPAGAFIKDMLFVGSMRCATVVLGLVAVKYVAVSFVETVKASAPFFTVGLAWLMLGERTSMQLTVTLVPVVMGLVLCRPPTKPDSFSVPSLSISQPQFLYS